MFQPLFGIRVVDLTQILAGPYATYQLALLGAEVIKVEPPEVGDWTRTGAAPEGLEGQGMSTGFMTQNAAKKSVALDLKSEQGHAALLALVETADVFVENFRPGTAARLGLSYEAIKVVKPGIIYCSISAYGQDGPIGHRPAYDHVVQGMCGIMRTTGTPQTEPNKVGAPYIDYATGMNAAFAIVAALHEVRRTGGGVRLDVAMLDTSLLLMASLVTNHLNTGWIPTATGNEAWSQSPSSGAFETTDGTLMIAANNERQFRDLCRVIDLGPLLDDPRFDTPACRRDHVPELRRLIAERIKSQSADHWETVLDAAHVPAARVRSLDEVLAEPQMQARELTRAIPVPGDANPRLQSRWRRCRAERPTAQAWRAYGIGAAKPSRRKTRWAKPGRKGREPLNRDMKQ
jgi:crotonobetainyl-CoA:carnitine CoA-transferase CaiB-like acyl-CoA transferase